MAAAKEKKSCEQWQKRVLENIQSLPSIIPPDCCIMVGTERILVHKTALQSNNFQTASEDVVYNKQSGLIEIEILPEFSEYFDLVSSIVDSFYSGNLKINQENMKTIYKFAKCYSVQWVMDYATPIFVDYIEKDEGCQRFVEIVKFAQSMCCTDLSDACCELLDSRLLTKISESNAISQFEFFSIKSITSSNKLRIPERDLFDLIVDWIKIYSSRCQNFGTILESIQYHLIDTDYLSDVVFDFILDHPDLADISRKTILKKVRDSLRQYGDGNTRPAMTESISRSVAGMFSANNDECLRKVALWMKGDRREEGLAIKISHEELKSVISDKFKSMADKDREIFISYLCKLDYDQVDPLVDQLLPLHGVYPCLRLLWLVVEHYTVRNYLILYDIPWNLVSFQTVWTILTNSSLSHHIQEFDCGRGRQCKNVRSCRRFVGCGQLELIMLWSLGNPLHQDEIKELMKRVCFRKIPQVYKEKILLPHVKTIFPDLKELKCSHEHKKHETSPPLLDMISVVVPGEIYLLKAFTRKMSFRNFIYELKFSVSFDDHCSFNLTSVKEHMDQYTSECHAYVFFDKNNLLPMYPLFVRDVNRSTIDRIIKCYKAVQVMFYVPADLEKDYM